MRSSMWLRLMASSGVEFWRMTLIGRSGESELKREAAARETITGRVILLSMWESPRLMDCS